MGNELDALPTAHKKAKSNDGCFDIIQAGMYVSKLATKDIDIRERQGWFSYDF